MSTNEKILSLKNEFVQASPDELETLPAALHLQPDIDNTTLQL